MVIEKNFRSIRKKLVLLSHELGKPSNRLAILGEGNTSTRVDGETFLIKASGSQLGTLAEDEVVHVRFDHILSMMDKKLDQQQTEDALWKSKVERSGQKPSVETTFHAWLLQQKDVNFVGHTHAVEPNKILCSDKADDFANRRIFPDEVVCCGPKSMLIEYVDPGTELACVIRDSWRQFVKDNGLAPNLILLKNHGIIAVGPTLDAVVNITFMAVKAAEILNGAYANGRAVFMDSKEVYHIHNRLDEDYRRKRLAIS